MEENKITAIYAIKDIREDKVIYIGLSTDYVYRKYYHFHSKQRPISKFMFDEGRENFDMYIIEKIDDDCDLTDLRNKEQYYIEKYNTIEDGFNINRSGNIKSSNPNEYNRNFHREYQKSEKQKEYRREYQKSDKWKEYHREYYLKRKKENTTSII